MKKIILSSCIFIIAIVAKGQNDITHFIDSIAAKHLKKNHGLAMIIGINISGKE